MATTSTATSMVRLPSIDHGLSPFPDGFMPLRRGSLTDPLLHAHTAPVSSSSSSPHRADQGHIAQQQQQQQDSNANYYQQRHNIVTADERDGNEGGGSASNGGGSAAFSGYSLRRPTPDVKPLFPQPSHHLANGITGGAGNGDYFPSPTTNGNTPTSATSYYSHEPLLGKRKASIRGGDGDLEGDTVTGSGSNGSGRSSSERRSSDGSNQQQQQQHQLAQQQGLGYGSTAYAFPPLPPSQQHQQQYPPQHLYTPGHSATQSPIEGALNFEGYSFGGPGSNRNVAGHPGMANHYADGNTQIPRVSFSDHDDGLQQQQHDGRMMSGNLPPESMVKASSIFGASTGASGPSGRGAVVSNSEEGMSLDGSSSGGGNSVPSGAGGKVNPANRLKVIAHKETPYSRTPELRVSHKIAERKRRKEMKELFDDLRDTMPAERGVKTSKWEVLSKSVEYIGRLHATQEECERTIGELKGHINHLEGMLAQSQNQPQQQQQQVQVPPLPPMPQQQHSQQHPQHGMQQGHHNQQQPNAMASPQHQHLHLSHPASATASPVSVHSLPSSTFSRPHNHHLQYPSHPGLQPHHSHPGYGDSSGASLNASQSEWPPAPTYSNNQQQQNHNHHPHQPQHNPQLGGHHRSHSYPHPTGSAPPVIQTFDQAAQMQGQGQAQQAGGGGNMSAPPTSNSASSNLGSGAPVNSPLYRPASIHSHHSSQSIHSIHSQSPQIHPQQQQQQQQQQPLISPPSLAGPGPSHQQMQHHHQQHQQNPIMQHRQQHGHGHSMSQSTVTSDYGGPSPFGHAPPPSMPQQQQQQDFGNPY